VQSLSWSGWNLKVEVVDLQGWFKVINKRPPRQPEAGNFIILINLAE
jgi:hypothetical protein